MQHTSTRAARAARAILVAGGAAGLLGAPSTSEAATFTWRGGRGLWGSPANWLSSLGSRMPGPADTVVIASGVPRVTGGFSVGTLEVAPGAGVEVAGTLRVNTRADSRGQVFGAGVIQVASTATALFATPASAAPVNFPRVTNAGVFQLVAGPGTRFNFFGGFSNSGSAHLALNETSFPSDIDNHRNLILEVPGGTVFKKLTAHANTLKVWARAQNPDAPIVMEDFEALSGATAILRSEPGRSAFAAKQVKANGGGRISIEECTARLEGDLNNEAGGRVTLSGTGALLQKVGSSTKFNNKSGALLQKMGAGTFEIGLEWINEGVVEAVAGTLAFRAPLGKPAKNYGGTLTLKGGAIQARKANGARDTVLIDSGTFGGTGSIDADVVHNGGVLAPGFSPGSMTINGNYTQNPNATLNMEIGGLAPGSGFDQLLVNGRATLSGTLNILQWNKFVPPLGTSFQLLKYYSALVNFKSVSTAQAGATYRTSHTSTNYVATSTGGATTQVSAAVSSPRSDVLYPSLALATGTATGSGALSVSATLYRLASPTATAGYWAGGDTWTPTYSVSNEIPAPGGAQWSLRLPALKPGRYWIRATARDVTGKSAQSAQVPFIISAGSTSSQVAERPATDARLSTAHASAADDSVSLRFRTAMAPGALDASRYAVSINGVPAAIEAVEGESANAVRLLLEEGAMEPGDAVRVAWSSLPDASGSLGSGQVAMHVQQR